ncbi:uncharacterized protein LOC128211117 isoform X2 [Mya arenaria]|uniref:uncharacterized protein LOC128211117 isoform X2 n=1 Tax=Mya arenaria TaxID=6604 RepID=UPI0022E4A8A0|nr:uncharacterized protein LOC128211117 isoform X2 [Mya arenaria]
MSRPSGSGNEEEFAYSSSGSEGEGTWEGERPTGKSVLNVFKGYHVPGKYKPSMDESIEQSMYQQSSDNQYNKQPEESAASQIEESIQGPSFIASMPDSMQQQHSLSEDCSIIGEGPTLTPETSESDIKRSPPPVPHRHFKSQIVRELNRSTLSDNMIETDAISLTVESDSVDHSDSETQENLMAGSDEYSSYTDFTHAQGYPPAAGYDANAFQGQYGVQAEQKYDPQPYWQPYPGQQPYIPNAQYQAPRFPQWGPFPYYPYVQPYQHTPDFDKANRPTFGYESAPFKQKDKESFKPEKTPRRTKDTAKQRQHRTPTEPAVKLEQERKQNQRHVESKKPQNRNQSRSTESLRQVENDTTKYCIFAKGIDPKAPEEHIITLFEVCMGNTVDYIQDSMVFNLPKTCAVFSVEGKPDMEYMKRNFAKRRNLSFYPELHLLGKTPMIAISFNGGVTVDMLELYFESERNGGGDVEGTPYETDDGICTIVTFSDAEVVERVCAKKDHTLNGQSLRVSPFYKCELGELYDAELHKFSLPQPIAFSLSTAKSQLLKKTCCSKFLKDLEAHFCECEITENTLKLSCCLTTATPNVMQLRMSWLGDVTYLVEHFFENVTDNRILDFSHKIFTNVNDYCTTFSKHPDVVVLWDESKCLIEVFGLRASTSAVFENIEGKVKQWERQLTMITERIHISFIHIKLMEKRGLIRRLKAIPELDVRVDDDFVDLKGQPSDITQAKLVIHESINKMKVSKYKHGLSFECAELVRSKASVIALIDESLKEKRIEASWKIEGSAFHVVFVKDQQDDYGYANMSDMDSDIVSVFSNILENFILYERGDKGVFHSGEWIQFITDLTKEHDDFAAFDIDEKKCRIGLHGWHENVNEMYKSIESFLDKRVLRTLVLKRGTIQIGFIQRFNRVDIDDLQKNLKEYNGFIAFSDDSETVEIRGRREDREIVRDELEQILNSVIREEHTIKNMSVKGALQDKKSLGKIDEIETITRCLIRLPGEHETFQYGAKDDADIGDDQVPGAMAASARGEIGKLKFQSSSRRMNVRFMGERNMQYVNPKIRQKAYSNTGYVIIENGVRIFGVNMQLFIGDIFEHKADAIVTSVGSNLELHGAVANGLKKRCPRVKQQCQAQLSTFQKDGILITTCQGLEARQAILVKHVERPSDWKAQMKMCFEVANRSEIKTVAFPILGSGAETLFDALDEFMSDGNTDLKISEVHLIVFKTQAERFQPIIDVLCSKAMKATSDLESGSFGQIKKAGRKLWKRTKEFVDVGYMVSEEGATTQPRHSPSSSKRNTSTLALYIYSDSSENIQRCK